MLEKLVENAPVSAALIIMVIYFLRSMDKRDERLNMMQNQGLELMKTVASEFQEKYDLLLKRTCDTIDRNTQALMRFSKETARYFREEEGPVQE